MRFGKWLLKAIVSYAVFIAAGLLLSFVPARRLGLSEEMFLNLRMFFMLFGPIYLTLFVKIILTFIAAAKRREPDVSERSRGILFAVTALLLFANLSNAQTISDLASGTIQGKGLRNLEKSKQHSLKGKRFLNVFLPVGFYLLILELLTLLVCIVTFAPLPGAASNAFIFTIALTALLFLLPPLILSFISGYQGDKAKHENKRAQEKQKAVQSDVLVLETDPIRRKRYLRLPKILALLICPGVCLTSGLVLALTKNSQELLSVRLLRTPFLALMAAAVFLFIPLLMYWANCSGTSLVQLEADAHDLRGLLVSPAGFLSRDGAKAKHRTALRSQGVKVFHHRCALVCVNKGLDPGLAERVNEILDFLIPKEIVHLQFVFLTGKALCKSAVGFAGSLLEGEFHRFLLSVPSFQFLAVPAVGVDDMLLAAFVSCAALLVFVAEALQVFKVGVVCVHGVYLRSFWYVHISL